MNCECIYNYQWAGSLSFMRKTRPKSHWVVLCSSKKLWPIRSSFGYQGLQMQACIWLAEIWTCDAIFRSNRDAKWICLIFKKRALFISISTRNEIFFPLTYINKLALNPNARQIVTWTTSQLDLMIWLLIGWKSAQNFKAIIEPGNFNGASIWFLILHCRANKYNHEVFVCDFMSLGSAVSLFRRFINLVAVALIYDMKEKKTKALLIEQDRQFPKTRGLKFLICLKQPPPLFNQQ